MSREIATEEQFRALMEEVDRELRDQQVPITARQLNAFSIIRRRLQIVVRSIFLMFLISRNREVIKGKIWSLASSGG
jgi:hypothetical protein